MRMQVRRIEVAEAPAGEHPEVARTADVVLRSIQNGWFRQMGAVTRPQHDDAARFLLRAIGSECRIRFEILADGLAFRVEPPVAS